MERRAKFLEIVLGFMRGELTRDKAKERLFMMLAETEDDRDTLLCSAIFPLEMELKLHSAGRDRWNYLRRMLTIIVGDLPVREATVQVPGRHRLVALAGLAVVVAGTCFAGVHGLWVAWVVVGVLLLWRVVRIGTRALLEEFPFAPFPDEQSWRRHEHLVADLDVPEYKASVFEQPESGAKASWLGRALAGAVGIALTPMSLIGLLLYGRSDSAWLVCDEEEHPSPS